MFNKLTLSTAVLTLGTIVSVGAYAGSYGDTGAKTGGDSVYSQINYDSPQDQFSAADQDGSGYINEREFSSVKTKQKFNEVDRNADGMVSEEEMDEATAMQGGDY